MSKKEKETDVAEEQESLPAGVYARIQLIEPIQWVKGEDPIEYIDLGRLKGKHIKKLGKDTLMEDIFGIAVKIIRNVDVSTKFFDEMDARDCMAVSEVIGDFLDSGQETTKTT